MPIQKPCGMLLVSNTYAIAKQAMYGMKQKQPVFYPSPIVITSKILCRFGMKPQNNTYATAPQGFVWNQTRTECIVNWFPIVIHFIKILMLPGMQPVISICAIVRQATKWNAARTECIKVNAQQDEPVVNPQQKAGWMQYSIQKWCKRSRAIYHWCEAKLRQFKFFLWHLFC